VSERKRLEADLAVRERLATMGRLAAGVAHEVNNPLTFAMLNLEGVTRALASGTAGEEQRPRLLEMLGHIQTGLERVSRVVQDMRTISRVDAPPTSSVSVGRVITYAASVAAPEARTRAMLDVDVPDALYVRGDEARLGQVFVNLLMNAAQSIPEGEPAANRVEVRAKRLGDEVEVTVVDTGSGIPEAVRAHLFEPFYSTKAAGAGVGLGLSICQAIVTSFGGTIAADKTTGHGTCFRVRLPCADTADAPRGAVSTTAQVAPRRWRTLVVDDEPMLRSVVQQMLSPQSDVVAAESVDAALAVLASGAAFDAILCDIVMPKRSGMEFYEELTGRFPKMVDHVGFITGGVLDNTIEDFLETTGRPRVYKPFSVTELVETVRALAGD
jgi:CheY-like chemotaxis protein